MRKRSEKESSNKKNEIKKRVRERDEKIKSEKE